MKYNVVEIFDSIEGEGARQGLPSTFIRLAGCNLKCSWCDTRYACDAPQFLVLTISEILAKTNQGFRRVTLTGGEPLLHPRINALIDALSVSDYSVSVETNGSVDIPEIKQKLTFPEKTVFSVDYKLPASGETERMLWRNFETLSPGDSVKFIIGSDEDAAHMVQIVEKIQKIYPAPPPMFAGAAHGLYDPKTLSAFILSEPALKNVRLQVQLHKIINVR